MIGRRRLMMSALSKKEDIPVWDGTTVTTPAQDAEGYYLIHNAEEFECFRRQNPLQVSNKKCKIMNDFAYNVNWLDYASWGTAAPSNVCTMTSMGVAEIDGQGHIIYGLYVPEGQLQIFIGAVHDLRIYAFYHKAWYGLIETPTFNNIVMVGIGTSYVARFTGSSSVIKNCLIKAGLLAQTYTDTMSFWGYRPNCHVARNVAVIGDIYGSGGAGILARDSAQYYTVQNCFSVVNLHGGNSYSLAGIPSASSVFDKCYYDSNLCSATHRQGTGVDVKTQAFVDTLNANIDSDANLSGCTKWKLQTKGMLAGWPDLDF